MLFLFVILTGIAHGLAVSGKKTRHHLDFLPNHTQTDEYFITNKEGYTSDYVIYAQHKKGADLTEYFTIKPEEIEGVPTSQSVKFGVTLTLPEEAPDVPGESLTWIRVKIDSTESGFRAYPSIALSYYVFILYPFKYMEWELESPNMNVNQSVNITTSVHNLGEPVINNVYADISVKNLQTNKTIKNMRTRTESLEPRQTKELRVVFDSFGLDPGNYETTAIVHWDGNVSEKTEQFRIGSKNVKLLNYTSLFEVDAINQMDLLIESAWNTRIGDVYADIEIYEMGSTRIRPVAEFKSLNQNILPWQKRKLTAYFDTTGLEKGDYKIVIWLRYEGSFKKYEGIITIDEDINAKTVEEIPGKFKLDLSGIISPMNILIGLLIFFIALNAYFAVGFLKKKKQKPKETEAEEIEEIDQAVVDHVKEMKKKYKDEYIEEMMIKKGWPKKKVEKILKEANKK